MKSTQFSVKHLLILFVIFFSLNSFGQSTDWHKENAVDGTVSITKKKGQPQVVHNKAYFEGELVRIDNHINAINAKIETVNQNEEERLSAIESGWFEDMERIIGELNAQKNEAQIAINKIDEQ